MTPRKILLQSLLKSTILNYCFRKKKYDMALDNELCIYTFIIFYADIVRINKLYWHKAQSPAMKLDTLDIYLMDSDKCK